ncbi:MAG: Dabb family protein [Gemmataceae bacterium]|nr:Dabb family protein [Gemmataceae bacterium]
MKRLLAAVTLAFMLSTTASADEPAIGHMVFFQLKESTPEGRKKLVDACYKLLKDHEGVLYFSAGARGDEFKAAVNTTDWDVALHLVFKDKKSFDAYLPHPRHLKFVEENKDVWKGVKVYDSHVDASRK